MTDAESGRSRTRRLRQISFQKPVPAEPPQLRLLATELRAMLRGSRHHRLQDVGAAAGHLPKQRVAEMVAGVTVPDRHHVEALIRACQPSATVAKRILDLLGEAVTEERRLAAKQKAQAAILSGRAFGVHRGQLPIVASFKDWLALGVHPAITVLFDGKTVASELVDTLPPYVPRSQDESQLRPVLRKMASIRGPRPVQLVLVAGESMAGKSRTALEAMRAELGPWKLFCPIGPESLAIALDGEIDLRHTVVWLDEIQELLDAPAGTEQVYRLLASSKGPTVLLATIRTEVQSRIQGTRSGRLLDRFAYTVRLPRRPDPAELTAARHLATDPRIAEALSRIGTRYGIAECLAAGPQLLTRWQDALVTNPLAAVAVTAAIDCYRAGYTMPIPRDLLHELCRIYLDVVLQAPTRVPPDSLDIAIAWARQPISGASSLLVYHPGWGDQAFDYLLSHAAQPHHPPPDERIWSVLLAHATPQVLPAVARAAHEHGSHHITLECIRRQPNLPLNPYDLCNDQELRDLAHAGDREAAEIQIRNAADQGDENLLSELAAQGDRYAAGLLTDRLAHRGDDQALRELARAGYDGADRPLAALLSDQGKEDELLALAAAGNQHAARWLAELMAQRHDESGLRKLAESGNTEAANRLAEILYDSGNQCGLHELALLGNDDAACWLAELLFQRNDEAALLRASESGNRHAAWWLASRMARRGDEQGLIAMTDGKHVDHATLWLARMYRQQDRLSDLRRLTDKGNHHAAFILVEFLHEDGNETGLRLLADEGNDHAAGRLAERLASRADETGLRKLITYGNKWALHWLAKLLTDRGAVTELQTLMEDGANFAADALADLFAERGDEGQLRILAAAGNHRAIEQLCRLRAARGLPEGR